MTDAANRAIEAIRLLESERDRWQEAAIEQEERAAALSSAADESQRASFVSGLAVGFVLAAAVALVTVIAAVLWPTAAHAKTLERPANAAWCLANGGKAEQRNSDGTWTDCLLPRHAVEAEHIWSDGRKWYESGFQAIHYARLTNRLPGVLFIVDEDKDCELLPDALQAVSRVRYWTGRRWVPVTVWTTGECNDD